LVREELLAGPGDVIFPGARFVHVAVVHSSYFFRRPQTLRRIQAGAALLWVMDGIASSSQLVTSFRDIRRPHRHAIRRQR
jgi:hypothetical protein